MRPLRYSINVTLDGCCDHRVITRDEDLRRHAAGTLARADPLIFGGVVLVFFLREMLPEPPLVERRR